MQHHACSRSHARYTTLWRWLAGLIAPAELGRAAAAGDAAARSPSKEAPPPSPFLKIGIVTARRI